MTLLTPEAYAVLEGRHSDPFRYLGPHLEGDLPVVRVFLPDAEGVLLVDEQGHECDLRRIHDAGLFEGHLAKALRRYRVRARYGERQVEIEDPYRFPPILSDLDLYLLGEGTHLHLYEKLGAHRAEIDGVGGVQFAVWAPNARSVSVIGDFNGWDRRQHAMRVLGASGIWEIFIPGLPEGELYKFQIKTRSGFVTDKADPYGFEMEVRPRSASRVNFLGGFDWTDAGWLERRKEWSYSDAPMAVYEVHLGSWMRTEKGEWLQYREIARRLVDYV